MRMSGWSGTGWVGRRLEVRGEGQTADEDLHADGRRRHDHAGRRRAVPKDDLRVEAYGTVDEANATIGLAVSGLADAGPRSEELRVLLTTIQNDMFDVGADLCRPVAQDEAEGARLRITDAHVKVLEEAIDLHNARLESLDSFVLPGGSEAAARLHVARTVVRRAERLVTTLLDRQPGTTNDAALRYLNRLSDLLFVLGRVANDDGRKDVKWVPGRQLGR